MSHARLNELRAAAAAESASSSSSPSDPSCPDVPVAAFDHLVEDQNLRYEFFHVAMCEVQVECIVRVLLLAFVRGCVVYIIFTL